MGTEERMQHAGEHADGTASLPPLAMLTHAELENVFMRMIPPVKVWPRGDARRG
jgi:hypothetical protein